MFLKFLVIHIVCNCPKFEKTAAQNRLLSKQAKWERKSQQDNTENKTYKG